MELIDWYGPHQHAMSKALQARNYRVQAAYLDLAHFYDAQLRRMQAASGRVGTFHQFEGRSTSADGYA